MTGATHGIIGLVCYGGIIALGGDMPDALALGVAGLSALAPDIDHRGSRLGFVLWPISTWIEKKYGHRTITHSVVGLLIFAALCLPMFLHSSTRFWFPAAIIGYISHLLADAATKSGVPLAWPNRARYVFPGDANYRVRTGSMAELCIMLVFLAIGAVLIPIAKAGPRRLLHMATGDMPGALRDQEDYGKDSDTEIELDGYDTLGQSTVTGRFPVVGRRGDGGLLIERDGKLWVVKESGDEQYRIKPRRVRIYPTTPRRTLTRAVRVGNLTIGALARLLPAGARITGEMSCYPSNQPHISAPPIGVKTVAFDSGGKVVSFDFATRVHLHASSPGIALQPATVTITYNTKNTLPRLLWPTHRASVGVGHMRRHADLRVLEGSFVKRGQVLNVTFAQRIIRPAVEVPADPSIALAAAEKRAALGKLKALSIEENAMRRASVWGDLSSSFAARRAALESAANQVIAIQTKPQPIVITAPQPIASQAPFDGVVDAISWEPPTLPQEKGELPEHSAQLSLVEIQR